MCCASSCAAPSTTARRSGLNEPFLYKMSGHVVQMMKDAYPELVETERHVAKAIKMEEERYAHTTRRRTGKLVSDVRLA